MSVTRTVPDLQRLVELPRLGLRRLPWWSWIVGLHIFLIFFTILVRYIPASIRYSGLHHFDLGAEMNIATWWSAINMLLLALFAAQIYSHERPQPRIAWLALFALLLILYMDEAGSIHERDELTYLPHLFHFSIAGLMMACTGLFYLQKQTRRPAVSLGIAFLLMLSVVVKERIENMGYLPHWFLGIGIGLEEGTELFSLLVIWQGINTWRARRRPLRRLAHWVPNPAKIHGLLPILAAAWVGHILLSLLMVRATPILKLGNPVILYPVGVYFLLSCAALWEGWALNRQRRARWVLLAALWLAFSILEVYYLAPRNQASRIYQLAWFGSYEFLSLVRLVLYGVMLWALRIPVTKLRNIGLVVGLVVASGLLAVLPALEARYILSGVLAFLTAALFLPAMKR